MDSLLYKAIKVVQKSEISFSKYITANDAGATGAHQSGFHLPKNSWPLFFDKEGQKGSNQDKFITIKWQDDFETSSRFIYYGAKTRNEYRLTRFGKGFPFLEDKCIGDLLVICRVSSDQYEAFVLQTDNDIEEFFASFNIDSTGTNKIISKEYANKPENKQIECFRGFLLTLKSDFPSTYDLAFNARNCYNLAFNISGSDIRKNPDKELLNWISSEFELFKTIENDRYSNLIKLPFNSVEDFINVANTILNRRKSRAGKSLEHHLFEIFKTFELNFETQSVTEDKKKPDFLFPSVKAYNDSRFDLSKIVALASKTTCKDRWRQVLNEADRIKTKHLFTLQQGISTNQLNEMYKYNVQLVVPKPYLNSFPESYRSRILTLNQFVNLVKEKQGVA